MRRTILCLPILLAGWLLSAACASPPERELAEARQEVERARAAGAEAYASTVYGEARAALARADTANRQREYRQARAFAVESRERAQQATRIAGEQKAVARADTLRDIQALEAAIAEARQRVETSQGGIETRSPSARLQISAVRRAIVVANVALQKAREAMTRDDYAAARQAIGGVADHLKAVGETTSPEGGAPPGRKTP